MINQSEGVQECAVIGLPNKFTGEEIIAVIKIKQGYIFAQVEKELKAVCAESLSAVQCPSKFIELLDFPKTSSNKIQKNKIRSWVKDNMKTQAIRSYPTPKTDFFKASNVVDNAIQATSTRYNNMVLSLIHI